MTDTEDARQAAPTRPLDGIRVVELAGMGPGPFGCMLLADLGADVVRVTRPGDGAAERDELHQTLRGRTVVEADLKDPVDAGKVRTLLARSDVLVEGFRPGVIERLGFAPEVLQGDNPGLIIARMTGWGQTGPWAPRAGHDINYLSLTGALHAIGTVEQPLPPLNLVADYGGGGMFLVTGVLAALVERARTGAGQVIDVAMLDGVSLLMQEIWRWSAMGRWADRRGANFIDGTAPYYRAYECSDGGFMAVGPVESKFYTQLLDGLGLDAASLPDQNDQSRWPELAEAIAAVFRTRPRSHWERIFEATDACATPVLAMREVAEHPQVRARRAVQRIGDLVESGEAPRFSRGSRRVWTREERDALPADLDEVLAARGEVPA
jgi:alpha-methylacyl-CoA racemase